MTLPSQQLHQVLFLGRRHSLQSIIVPPSKPYIEELQRCCADPKRLSHLTSDGRNLEAMQEAGSYGLDRMAPVDPSTDSSIVSPDEALRPDAHCPRPQCRLTDDLLIRAYNIAACMGRIGNSLSHLILGLSQVLQESGVDSSTQTLSDTSHQTFALMSKVTLACHQVWLAQSSLSEGCHCTLSSLPVVPGHMFGPAAQQVLERSAQVDQEDQPPVVTPPKAPGGGGLDLRLKGPVSGASLSSTSATGRGRPQTLGWYPRYPRDTHRSSDASHRLSVGSKCLWSEIPLNPSPSAGSWHPSLHFRAGPINSK